MTHPPEPEELRSRQFPVREDMAYRLHMIYGEGYIPSPQQLRITA